VQTPYEGGLFSRPLTPTLHRLDPDFDPLRNVDWLEKAYDDRDPIFWWINGDQLYDSVRHAPRFEGPVQKVVRTKAESKK
jgi:hypothetical protein